jgi:hypothetical protein
MFAWGLPTFELPFLDVLRVFAAPVVCGANGS